MLGPHGGAAMSAAAGQHRSAAASSWSTTTSCFVPGSGPSWPATARSSARRPIRREALAVIAATRPHVVLLDVHLPDGGGVAVLEGAGGAGRRAAGRAGVVGV